MTTLLSVLPENAIISNEGELRTTSLKVAEAFGKRHDDVLRKIKNIDCSEDFNARNFAVVDYLDKKGELRKAYQMTKDGFMFLVMGFTGKKAAAIKEAYINAFNKMAEQLYKSLPAAPQQPALTVPSNHLPNYYDSGWIPALYQRCLVESHWTYHIKFSVRPEGGKFKASFVFGVGGKGQAYPNFESSAPGAVDANYLLEFRSLDELWENIHLVLKKYGARCPFPVLM